MNLSSSQDYEVLEKFAVYYGLSLIIVAAIIASMLGIKWIKPYFRYIIAFGWAVFVVNTGYYLYEVVTMKLLIFDFSIFWKAGQAVWRGENPYLDPDFVNPPTALPIYALFGLLPWKVGVMIWTGMNALGAATLAFFAYRMFQAQESSLKLPSTVLQGLAVITALSLSSHLSLRLGQVTFLVTFCIVLALYAQAKGNRILAGLSYAIATVKPHTALPFLLLFTSKRNWQTWSVIAVSVIVLSVVVSGPFQILEWMQIAWSNITALSKAGANNDYSSQNWNYHSLVGLDLLFYRLGLNNRSLVRFCQLATLSILGFWIYRNAVWGERWSLGLLTAIVSLYAMIFMYHRFHDGIILVIPLVYVVIQLQTSTGRSRQFLAAALITMTVAMYWHPQLNAFIVRVVDRLGVDFFSYLTSAIFIPLHTWLILASLFLVYAGYFAKGRVRGLTELEPD